MNRLSTFDNPIEWYYSPSTILGSGKWFGELYLLFEVVTTEARLPLYVVDICPIEPHEQHMQFGRFENFDATLNDNPVLTRCDSSSGDRVNTFLTERIEWLAEQTRTNKSKWGFVIDSQHVHSFAIEFYFSDPDLALMFKLKW